ncbi:hypothetical protein [Nocardia arizonensis]|uniref:hypothetical protein n=1 Tax=Nocardia arizonensis TaxID=1141647 RepID=UPI0012E0DB7C|nr:hypothetical protein [Nocardia arizonensis]
MTLVRLLGTALMCCLVVAGCQTTTSPSREKEPPFERPPADCGAVGAASKQAVSDFAGNLYDPKIEFRSERPVAPESVEFLTCYGAYVADERRPAVDGSSPSASTVFITIGVYKGDTWSGVDPIEDAKRLFVSYRDEHAAPVEIIHNLGDEAYGSKTTSDTDARAEVDFRIENAIMRVRLNHSNVGSSARLQESDVEAKALALARALADNVDSFM